VRRFIRTCLDEGIVLFNRGQFFEAHEVWEDGWHRSQGDDRMLLHGLIQVAAGFHKLQCGQPTGAASLFAKGLAKLAPIAASPMASRLGSFRADVEVLRRAAGRHDTSTWPRLPEPRHRSFERRLHSHIEIDAPAQRVWEVLEDFRAYPIWNPFIIEVTGAARVGGRLAVRIVAPGQRGLAFRPTILAVDPHRELRWLGRLVLPGLFDGEHVFTIAPLTPGRVRFSQRETFRGVIVPLLPRTRWEGIAQGFEKMNAALKRRAEGR
jgi:hypothetical protein